MSVTSRDGGILTRGLLLPNQPNPRRRASLDVGRSAIYLQQRSADIARRSLTTAHVGSHIKTVGGLVRSIEQDAGIQYRQAVSSARGDWIIRSYVHNAMGTDAKSATLPRRSPPNVRDPQRAATAAAM